MRSGLLLLGDVLDLHGHVLKASGRLVACAFPEDFEHRVFFHFEVLADEDLHGEGSEPID